MAISVADITKGVEVVFKNKEVRWASVHTPDERFDPCWKADILFNKKTDAKEIKAYMDLGFNFKEYKNKEGVPTDPDIYYLRAKSKCNQKSGKANKPPVVVGRDGRTPFSQDIGNSSTCNVKVYVKENIVTGKRHVTLYLNAVQVVNHVEYGGGAFDSVDGENGIKSQVF